MATKTYLAAQVRRTEKHSITVTAVAVGGIIGITINSKTVQYICVTGDTTATAAAGLALALRSAVDAEFQRFTAQIDGTTDTQINIEANVPGDFLSADGATAFTEVESGGATITAAVVQAAKSPYDAADTVNWSGGALPANSGDTVYFQDAPFGALYRASTAFTGKTFDALYVRPQFSGAGIGLPKFAPSGYAEYLGGRLILTGCTVLDVEIPDQAGFEAFRFNVGAAANSTVIRGQANGVVGQEVVEWIGTHASATVEVYGGSIRIAPYIGDVATVSSLKMVNGVATVGSGVTLTTLDMEDSQADIRANFTTGTLKGTGSSQVVLRDSVAVTTLTITSGTVFHNSAGNITTLTIGPGSTIDFSGSDKPITITNQVQLHRGATFWDPNGRVTLSAGWTTVQCNAADVTTNFGAGRSYTVA